MTTTLIQITQKLSQFNIFSKVHPIISIVRQKLKF